MVLPAPFAPTIAVRLPGARSRSTLWRISARRRRTVSPRARMIGSTRVVASLFVVEADDVVRLDDVVWLDGRDETG